jgi:hypothetical protein
VGAGEPGSLGGSGERVGGRPAVEFDGGAGAVLRGAQEVFADWSAGDSGGVGFEFRRSGLLQL